MAPAATENVVVPVEGAQKSVKDAAPTPKPSNDRRSLADYGSTVPTDTVLPEVLTDHREPLKLSGALDKFEHFDVTPVIGREFVNVNLAEVLRAPNSDELIRDLAITSKHSQINNINWKN